VVVTRRDLVLGAVGTALGSLGLVAGLGEGERLDARAHHLRDLASDTVYASAVHPDLSPPSASTGAVVWSGGTGARRLALTFDDGPRPAWTPRVLEVLARHDVPATFFLRGDNVALHGPIHRDSVGRHELGNHTWDHPDLARLGYTECRDQLRRTSRIMADVYGVRPTLFRPPYGHVAGSSLLAAAEERMVTVIWSMQMRENLYLDHPSAIVDAVRSQVRPGSLILAHDTGARTRLVTLDHLDGIITALTADGYELTTVSDLCGLPGGDVRAPAAG
jgi:peptidoglycan/xylan/chitin deacetylase (PgdA/CDA1 family)